MIHTFASGYRAILCGKELHSSQLYPMAPLWSSEVSLQAGERENCALCILNKEDSMDVFTQVPSVNSRAALSHLWLFPRVFKGVALTEALWPQSIWNSISLITRRLRMHWDLTYRYIFDKIYLSQRLTKSTAKKVFTYYLKKQTQVYSKGISLWYFHRAISFILNVHLRMSKSVMVKGKKIRRLIYLLITHTHTHTKTYKK